MLELGLVFVLFTLLVGLATVALGVSLAVSPGERKLAILRPLSVSTVFASVAATCAGLGITLKRAADGVQAGGPLPTDLLLAGLAEATVPVFVGLALVAVAWLLAAVGLRKQL